MNYHLVTGYIGAGLQVVGMASQVHHSFTTTNGFQALCPTRIATDITTNVLTLVYAVMINSIPICVSSSSVVAANLILGGAYCSTRYKSSSSTTVEHDTYTGSVV